MKTNRNIIVIKKDKICTFCLIILFLPISLFSQDWESLISKSDSFLQKGRSDSSQIYLEKALTIAIKEGPAKHAVTLGRLAAMNYKTGDFTKAYEYYVSEKNLEKSVFGSNHPLYAITLNNLSVVLQLTGRYSEAEKYLLEDLEIKKNLYGTNDTNYSKTLHNLAKLQQTMGNLQEAEKNYLKALDIKKSISGADNPITANTQLNLGILYYSLYNNKEALRLVTNAYDTYKKHYGLNDNYTILSAVQLALVYTSEGKNDEAARILNSINVNQIDADNFKSEFSTILYDFGILRIAQGNYAEAEALLLKAQKSIEKYLGKTSSYYSSCLNSLGILFWIQGKYENALKYLNQVASLRELFFGENHPEYSVSLFNLAGLYYDMGNYMQAERYFKKGIETTNFLVENYFPFLSEDEKEKYYDNLRFRFDMFDNFVLSRIHELPALSGDLYNSHLTAKSILLNNLIKIRGLIVNSKDKELNALFEKWKNERQYLSKFLKLSKNEIKSSFINPDSIQIIISTYEKEISTLTKKQGIEFTNKPTSWQEIRNALGQDEAAIEIIRSNVIKKGLIEKSVYLALIIKKETDKYPELIVLDDKNELEDVHIKKYINYIRSKNEDKDSYNAFWSKIDERLKGIKKIYFSPDGVYNKININSILQPNGKYVVEDKVIVMLGSTSAILSLNNSSISKINDALLIGNPAFSSPNRGSSGLINLSGNNEFKNEYKKLSFPSLPGTEKEVNDIESILKGSNIKVTKLQNEEASKSEVMKAVSPDILHLATHGFFMPDESDKDKKIDFEVKKLNPMFRSGLLLKGAGVSDETDDNGILTSYEVMNQDLTNTELVVLSACETGLGDIKNGEGVYGLKRAFFAAGAKSIILSLWKVNDDATQKLMSSFYRNLMQSKSIDDAFRSAQLELKKEYPKPYFWGGFIKVEG